MKLWISLFTIGLCLLVGWFLLADRATPFTSNARVKAVVTPIVPRVSGTVAEVLIENGALVEAGTLLARIDPTPYQIDKATAEANLAAAVQEVGASAAEVSSAQARLARAESELETIRLQVARVFALERKGLTPKAQADEARGLLAESEASRESAAADLERAKQQLGADGQDNPRIQRALAALAQAELMLDWTELTAPATGAVSNLNVAPGSYAQAGQPLMTFVDSTDIWIEAYMTENNLGHAYVGAPVQVVLDIHPGRVLDGTIESFSGAVSGGEATGALARAPNTKGFLREAERFPVRILLSGYETGDATDDLRLQVNGQADVILYLTDNAFLTALGRAYIRAASIFSYAY